MRAKLPTSRAGKFKQYDKKQLGFERDKVRATAVLLQRMYQVLCIIVALTREHEPCYGTFVFKSSGGWVEIKVVKGA